MKHFYIVVVLQKKQFAKKDTMRAENLSQKNCRFAIAKKSKDSIKLIDEKSQLCPVGQLKEQDFNNK